MAAGETDRPLPPPREGREGGMFLATHGFKRGLTGQGAR
jgi:hypothetical protein